MSNKKDDQPKFDWISFPFVDRPSTSALLSVFLLVFVYLLKYTIIALQLPGLWWIIGILLIVTSVTTYFIPTRYTFFRKKVEIRYWFFKIERPYSDFGCFYSDKYGVMLSTFSQPRRLDPFRGTSIRYSKTQEEKADLLAFLEEKIGKRY